MKHSVLLDTSFLIRLLNDEDSLHTNAIGYYKYFLDREIILKVSTISIAEYCVRGNFEDLPIRNLQIISFNLDHAKQTGKFADIIFNNKGISNADLKPRAIIPNDSKLFAQAETDKSVTHFITSDIRSKATFSILKKETSPKFEIISIESPFNETFGVLNL